MPEAHSPWSAFVASTSPGRIVSDEKLVRRGGIKGVKESKVSGTKIKAREVKIHELNRSISVGKYA